MCRWGFSNVVKTLKSVRDDRVRAYVVWLPIFGGNFNKAASELSRSFPDKRVSYYMDPESLTGNSWERVLKTEREMAWDVYFLYKPGARWEQEPPQPDFWMHQLTGVTKAPRLDEEVFRARLIEMLNEIEKPKLSPPSLATRHLFPDSYFLWTSLEARTGHSAK